MRSAKGFTLIELSVVLVLVAITAAIAIPSFSELIKDNRVQAQVEELNSMAQYARSEAVVRKRIVRMAVNEATGAVTVAAGGETLRAIDLNLDSVSFAVSHATLDYRPNGTSSVTNYRVLLCRDSKPSSGYEFTISGAGTVRLSAKGVSVNGAVLGSCAI